MRFSKNVERACGELEGAQAHQSDLMLAHLVKGQRLVERINQGLDFDPGVAQDDALSPTLLFVKAFAQEILRTRREWPVHLQGNSMQPASKLVE